MKIITNRAAATTQRAQIDFTTITRQVEQIIRTVQANGDRALFDYTKQFDGVTLTNLRADLTNNVPVTAAVQQALAIAKQNITTFHQAVMPQAITVETMPGVLCTSEPRAIDRVGLYVPGGSAPLVSTVLMLAIPAQLAGCKEIMLCTPPQPDGTLNPLIAYAAKLCGIEQVFLVGGAQAIAAMAYGTATIPKVAKLFGPGNAYVTAAKQWVAADPAGAAIDLPAGPTEVLVIADELAKPEVIAADLLAQLEHGADSQAVLVTTSLALAKQVNLELELQVRTLPRRTIAEQALQNSFSLVVGSVAEAIAFANDYAPEHLLLQCLNPERYTAKIRNAGSVFVGEYACESAGDYASGTNHTLPTYGYAKAYSGVSVASFQKQVTFQTVTKAGALALAPTVLQLAELEGLTAHKRAMQIRL
ncbi:MAG: histidinol dehydrogenase [Candidatus Kerfeldbacteria bacterium]|nr:histidinol dehydrogenase [Candidatus Kerfeldbacteria bacterium]